MKLGLNKKALLNNLRYSITKYQSDEKQDKQSKKFRSNREIIKDIQEEIEDSDKIKKLFAEIVFKEAFKLTPVDTGDLRKSMFMESYKDGYVIGYDSDYAIYVHEIGFYNHKPPTQYKFLEDAAYDSYIRLKDKVGNISIRMTYDPLRCYIGVTKGPGNSLNRIKSKQKKLTSADSIIKYLQDYSDNALDLFEYYAFTDYLVYWRNVKNISIPDIAKSWLDRKRHS